MFPELVEGNIIKINKKFVVQGHGLGVPPKNPTFFFFLATKYQVREEFSCGDCTPFPIRPLAYAPRIY